MRKHFRHHSIFREQRLIFQNQEIPEFHEGAPKTPPKIDEWTPEYRKHELEAFSKFVKENYKKAEKDKVDDIIKRATTLMNEQNAKREELYKKWQAFRDPILEKARREQEKAVDTFTKSLIEDLRKNGVKDFDTMLQLYKSGDRRYLKEALSKDAYLILGLLAKNPDRDELQEELKKLGIRKDEGAKELRKAMKFFVYPSKEAVSGEVLMGEERVAKSVEDVIQFEMIRRIDSMVKDKGQSSLPQFMHDHAEHVIFSPKGSARDPEYAYDNAVSVVGGVLVTGVATLGAALNVLASKGEFYKNIPLGVLGGTAYAGYQYLKHGSFRNVSEYFSKSKEQRMSDTLEHFRTGPQKEVYRYMYNHPEEIDYLHKIAKKENKVDKDKFKKFKNEYITSDFHEEGITNEVLKKIFKRDDISSIEKNTDGIMRRRLYRELIQRFNPKKAEDIKTLKKLLRSQTEI